MLSSQRQVAGDLRAFQEDRPRALAQLDAYAAEKREERAHLAGAKEGLKLGSIFARGMLGLGILYRAGFLEAAGRALGFIR